MIIINLQTFFLQHYALVHNTTVNYNCQNKSFVKIALKKNLHFKTWWYWLETVIFRSILHSGVLLKCARNYTPTLGESLSRKVQRIIHFIKRDSTEQTLTLQYSCGLVNVQRMQYRYQINLYLDFNKIKSHLVRTTETLWKEWYAFFISYKTGEGSSKIK